MHLIIVVEPDRELLDHRLRVGLGADAGIIALEGSDESFGHAVALRAFDRCGSWDEADVSRETSSVLCGVAAAVVSQPFDGVRQLVDAPEAMLDGGDHEIADIAGRYAARRCDGPHGFPVAAIESEGDADVFAVVAGNFEPIGAPAAVAGVDRDPAIVPTFLMHWKRPTQIWEGTSETAYFYNSRSKRVALKVPSWSITDEEGRIISMCQLVRPTGAARMQEIAMWASLWKGIERDQFQRLWKVEASEAEAKVEIETVNVATGLLLPVWHRLHKTTSASGAWMTAGAPRSSAG